MFRGKKNGRVWVAPRTGVPPVPIFFVIFWPQVAKQRGKEFDLRIERFSFFFLLQVHLEGVWPKSPAAEPKGGMALLSRASNAPKKQFKWIPGMESILFCFRSTGGGKAQVPRVKGQRVGCKPRASKAPKSN